MQKNALILYSDLALTEKLFSYLYEIAEFAHQRKKLIQKQLLENDPAPDRAINQIS